MPMKVLILDTTGTLLHDNSYIFTYDILHFGWYVENITVDYRRLEALCQFWMREIVFSA
jgi:hypothetical protein